MIIVKYDVNMVVSGTTYIITFLTYCQIYYKLNSAKMGEM